MPIERLILRKPRVRSPRAFAEAEEIASSLFEYMQCADVQRDIAANHQLNASSLGVQNVLLPHLLNLGFTPEKSRLFQTTSVPALRPDYYRKVRDTGILLEVERGKTTTNNMDLLDLWKCHICEHADYLFLLVPNARPSANGKVLRHYKHVQKRLGCFFTPRNYVNVDAVFLFGY